MRTLGRFETALRVETYHYKVPQFKVTSEGSSLTSNALHQAAVASEDYRM